MSSLQTDKKDLKDCEVYVFDFISGEHYKSNTIGMNPEYEFIIKSRPANSCRKCYGRGHIGQRTDVNQKYYIPCQRCVVDKFDTALQAKVMSYNTTNAK